MYCFTPSKQTPGQGSNLDPAADAQQHGDKLCKWGLKKCNGKTWKCVLQMILSEQLASSSKQCQSAWALVQNDTDWFTGGRQSIKSVLSAHLSAQLCTIVISVISTIFAVGLPLVKECCGPLLQERPTWEATDTRRTVLRLAYRPELKHPPACRTKSAERCQRLWAHAGRKGWRSELVPLTLRPHSRSCPCQCQSQTLGAIREAVPRDRSRIFWPSHTNLKHERHFGSMGAPFNFEDVCRGHAETLTCTVYW